jgi:capsular exopolysaccharide synthesis family protein
VGAPEIAHTQEPALNAVEGAPVRPIVKPQVWQPDSFPERLVVPPDGNNSWQQDAFARERFRVARTRLLELMRVRSVRTLMVTSAVAGEGKTFISANLAFAMSRVEGLKVLLIDADLQKASLGKFLRIKTETGLSTCLMNGKGLADARWQVSSNLAVVPTNPTPENSAELLNGRRMASFLQQAIQEYDLVVVDAPPVLPVADAQVLTSMVDAALLVVRARYCPYDLARDAAELLQPKLVGVVLNAVERFPSLRYYYSYYSYNGAGKQK